MTKCICLMNRYLALGLWALMLALVLYVCLVDVWACGLWSCGPCNILGHRPHNILDWDSSVCFQRSTTTHCFPPSALQISIAIPRLCQLGCSCSELWPYGDRARQSPISSPVRSRSADPCCYSKMSNFLTLYKFFHYCFSIFGYHL